MASATRVLEVNKQGVLAMPGARLVVLRGPDRGRAVRLEREELVVGTAPASDLVLTDLTVSRSHLAVRALPDGHLLVDLESTNGTFLDKRRIRAAYLSFGDVVQLGKSTLRFEATEKDVELAISKAHSFGGLLGRSVAARRLFALLETVAREESTVLLVGETGTGKDGAAQAIHDASDRADGAFVVVDCAALVPTLADSELFGHEKGAFTGADNARIGAFEEADGGTLFLDEIGELPREVQPKLLRAIDRRQIRRVGSTEVRPINVRIIAATNRDLRLEVNRGSFREDLFYRLNVITIRVPPLRERPEDIPLLANQFRREITGDREGELPEALVTPLLQHSWPGNVRELRNHVERILSSPEHSLEQAPGVEELSFRAAKERAIDAFERTFLTGLLAQAQGNVSEAARRGRVDRVHLSKLLRKHGIHRT